MRSLFWIAPVLSAVCAAVRNPRPDDVVVALHERMRELRKDSIKRRILAELKLQTEPRWSSTWPSQMEIEKILGTQLVGDGLPTDHPIRRTTRSPSSKSGAEMSYKFSFPIKCKSSMIVMSVCVERKVHGEKEANECGKARYYQCGDGGGVHGDVETERRRRRRGRRAV
jgi:hypothetical protein